MTAARHTFLLMVAAALLGACISEGSARAQSSNTVEEAGSTTIFGQPGAKTPITPSPPTPTDLNPGPMPYSMDATEMGDTVLGHVLFNQLEGRTNGPDNEFRWDGEGWIGTDVNKLWLKSEGFVEHGRASEGITEALYDRPIPFLRYFDVQAGIRHDLDSDPGRTWGAVGVEGLAPYFFEFAPTFYFNNRGVAGRITGSYDLLITQRLVLQPELEMNFYSNDDPSRSIGSGLSEIDAGLRLRYEVSRKFAPYIGVAYNGSTATFTRKENGIVNDPRFIFGIRVWHQGRQAKFRSRDHRDPSGYSCCSVRRVARDIASTQLECQSETRLKSLGSSAIGSEPVSLSTGIDTGTMTSCVRGARVEGSLLRCVNGDGYRRYLKPISDGSVSRGTTHQTGHHYCEDPN